MKKTILTLVVALMATVAVKAQRIAVVSESGTTSMYQTLPDAIGGADPGSVIYLPGGGFTISDDVKITKKLTIIGIGHYVKGDNVDGATTISGNLWFNAGSSGSAIMGCYITGNVNIGDGGASVNNMLIRYCNLNSVIVNNNTCMDILINQNYIRTNSFFNGANCNITNNVMHSISNVDGGFILNNIITGMGEYKKNNFYYQFAVWADNSIISNNVMLIVTGSGSNWRNYSVYGEGNTGIDNMAKLVFGENFVNVNGVAWSKIFNNDAGITPASNYHFTEDYSQYEGVIGIYAGNSFNDKQVAPVPYIVAKKVDEQTDAAGKLQIKIRVKASE